MPVDYKKIGKAIGESQRKSVEESKRLIQELQDSFAELNKDLVGTLKEDSHKLYAEHALQIEELCKQIQEQEVLKAQLDQRIAEIKDGEDGKDGEKGDQGEQGNDGLDRPLLEPVELKADKDYSKNILGTHNGGLWISKKDAVGNPDDDPHAWHCILDAMTTMSIDLQEDHTFKLSVRTSAGNLIEDEFHIPFPEHKGVWEEGSYTTGQIVTKGSSMWQAMEDTEKAPPGNGWKQILSAPRGKQGPAGKSIVGPTGKPGRNGLDAKLPEGFVDELIVLANMNKAFEDGRSDAYSITSFRGYFMPDESYSAGDVVNDLSGLYLCTQSGAYKNVGTGFELMMGVKAGGGGTAAGYMKWYGEWTQNPYPTGAVVTDANWTMVAETNTEEYPFPSELAPLSWAVFPDSDETFATGTSDATRILTGVRINASGNNLVQGLRVYIPIIDPNVQYYVYVVNPANDVPSYQPIFPTQVGWFVPPMSAVFVLAGESVDVYLVTQGQGTQSTTFTGSWDFRNLSANPSPGNPVPPDGFRYFGTNAPDVAYWSVYDESLTDRTADMSQLKAGDTVSFQWLEVSTPIDKYTTWTMAETPIYSDEVADNEQYILSLDPPSIDDPEGTQRSSRDFTATIFDVRPIEYVVETGRFAGNANLSGLYSEDGTNGVVETDDAYGIDIFYQPYSFPNDWALLAHNNLSTTSSVLEPREIAWVAAATSDLELGTVTTSTNGWVELGRYSVEAGHGYDVEFKVTGKRTDAIGFSAGRYGMLVYRNGGVNADYETMYEHMSAGLNVRARPDSDDVVIEVDGRTGQDWDWKLLGFSKEIT